jgi:hypothetical protein
LDGRTEDLLRLPGAGEGTVSVHPNVFHRLLEPLPIKQWQVRQTADGLDVSIVRSESPVDTAAVGEAISRELVAAGTAWVPVQARLVEKVAQTALGKTPLIMRLR